MLKVAGWCGGLAFGLSVNLTGYAGHAPEIEKKFSLAHDDGVGVYWRLGAAGSDGTFLVGSEPTSLAGMVNGYLDAGPYWGRVMSYIGAGVGVARNSTAAASYRGTLSGTRDGETVVSAAWQVMVGAGFYLTEATVLDLSDRYFDGGDLDLGSSGVLAGTSGSFSSSGAGEMKAIDIVLGLRSQY